MPKGHTNNPHGRPRKGNTISEALKEFMDGRDEKKKKERMLVLAEKIYALAKGGDMAAMKYIYDRIDGRPRETHDIKTPEGINIVVHDEIRRLPEHEPEAEGSISEQGEEDCFSRG